MKRKSVSVLGTSLVQDCLAMVKEKHQGQRRRSGEPFWTHPVMVWTIFNANTPSPFKTQEATITCLCHDLLEDTSVTAKELESVTGTHAFRMAQHLTKIQGKSQATHEKILAGISESPVISYIKLADRLHNLRTLSYLSPISRVKVAQETLEFYVPLAMKFAPWMTSELITLAMAHLNTRADSHRAGVGFPGALLSSK